MCGRVGDQTFSSNLARFCTCVLGSKYRSGTLVKKVAQTVSNCVTFEYLKSICIEKITIFVNQSHQTEVGENLPIVTK